MWASLEMLVALLLLLQLQCGCHLLLVVVSALVNQDLDTRLLLRKC